MTNVKRLQLKGKHLFIHYSFPLLVLLPAILSLIDIIKIWTGTDDGVRTINEYIETSLPFLAVGLLLIFRQYRRLNFRKIKMSYTDKDLQHALGKTSMERKWRVEKNRDGFFRAYRVGGDGPWWWGEMITIIIDDKTIFINSISDPNQTPTPSSFGNDGKNIRTFIKNLETIVNENKE
jgi:hypothetical protein